MLDPLTLPERLAVPLRALTGASTPPAVGLMRLLVEAHDPSEAEAALTAALEVATGEGARRLHEALALLRANPGAFETVRGVIDGVEHGGSGMSVEEWAAIFDRAARISPEGSVALYSLGNAELLAAATAEIVAVLRNWKLLNQTTRVLDFGCGIGRVAAAIAPEVGRVTGLDIAPAMIEEARRRCRAHANVRFVLGSGHDLAGLADAGFDLVLAIDSVPYLIQAGEPVFTRFVEEAARVLRPRGSLIILNLTYRADPGRDVADLRRSALACGLRLASEGERPFRLWDGVAFRLTREG